MAYCKYCGDYISKFDKRHVCRRTHQTYETNDVVVSDPLFYLQSNLMEESRSHHIDHGGGGEFSGGGSSDSWGSSSDSSYDSGSSDSGGGDCGGGD